MTWSSYIVLTEPIPDRLAEIGWTGGEGLADARFTLHYLRTDAATAGSPSAAAAAGPGSAAGSDAAFTDDATAAGTGRRRAAPAVPVAARTSGSRMPGAARSTSRPTTCPAFASVPGRPIHYAHGYSGNGVGPSVVAGRAAGRPGRSGPGRRPRRSAGAAEVLVGGRARAFPPEPFRYLGARVVREAIVRREAAEERGEPVSTGPARGDASAAPAGLPPLAGLTRTATCRPGPDGPAGPSGVSLRLPPRVACPAVLPCRSLRE